jgi:hypothetical protein
MCNCDNYNLRLIIKQYALLINAHQEQEAPPTHDCLPVSQVHPPAYVLGRLEIRGTEDQGGMGREILRRVLQI